MSKGLMKSVKGMAWMSSSIFMDYVINLLVTYVLARLLTQADYGEVAAITVLVGFANIFWQMGVGPALIQKKNISDKELYSAQTLNIIFGVSIFAVVNILAPFWANVFSISNVSMLRTYSLVFLFTSYNATPLALVQRKCNFKFMANLNVSSNVFYGGVAIVLAFIGFGPWSLIFATVSRVLFRTVLLVLKTRLKLRFDLDRESAKSLLYFGGGHTLARIFNYIANNGDTFVVNKTLTKADVGGYNKAYNLIGYPATLIGNTLDNVMFPILSKSQDDLAKIRKFFYTCTCFVALITLPISVTCVFCSKDLVIFFLSEKWLSIVVPFEIMIVALFFRTSYKISDTIIKSIGKVYHRSVVQIGYAAAVVLGAYLGHSGGLGTVALYVTIAFVLNYVVTTGLCMYFIKANVLYYLVTLAGPFAYALLSCGVGVLVKNYVSAVSGAFLVCVVWTIIIFSVYFILFLLTRRFMVIKEMNESFDSVMKSFLGKLKKDK